MVLLMVVVPVVTDTHTNILIHIQIFQIVDQAKSKWNAVKLFCCCCCCLFYLIIIASFHILPCLHFSSLLIINFYKQNTNANFFFVCSQKIEPHSLNHYIDSLSLSSSSSSSHTHLSVHL